MRLLITGATGFVGSHLAEHFLQATDCEVVGISRSMDHLPNVEHLLPRLRLHVADCEDASSIHQAVAAIRPDGVIHLAGQALEPISWEQPAETFMHNVVAQVNLFEALLKTGIRPRTVVVGSALAYGLVKPDENPITEDQPLRPASPYAVSKIATDYVGYQYFVSHGLPVLRVRPFNQLGPRQSPEFAVSGFAKQVAEIEGGRREAVLRVGNLDAVRDYTDVRDAAVAYRLILENAEPGEAYNLGSEVGYTMQSLLEQLLGMSSRSIQVEGDVSRLRPVDIPRIVADASKLRRQTGWAPSISIETSLRDTLQYWRDL